MPDDAVVLEPRPYTRWPSGESAFSVSARDFDGHLHVGLGPSPYEAVADWCQRAGFPPPPTPPGATFRTVSILRRRVSKAWLRFHEKRKGGA